MIGAGAAGLVAAIFAASQQDDVLVIERTADGGRKILISGGGRCNILPSALQPERFVTDSPPHLLRAMLRSWPLDRQRAFFEDEVGVPLALETDSGKLFPRSNRARDVRDGLVALGRARGVTFRFGVTVGALLAPGEVGGRWRIETSNGPIEADRVIVATGGLSVPVTGSDGMGLSFARTLGHALHATYPALTPLTSDTPNREALAGISLPVRLRARHADKTTEAAGGFLFTHRGYSGPAVLDISHVAVRSLTGPDRATVRVAWTRRTRDEWEQALRGADVGVATVLSRALPDRLVARLMADAAVPADRRTSALRKTERVTLLDALTAYELPWHGDEGYKKAEVTGGGVALTDVDVRTLQSRRHAGLYFCGEILDAFGPIGGHNFAWAWATGRAAGLGAGLNLLTS